MPKVLGMFDKAYVINLDLRKDRLGVVSEALGKVGVAFERFPAVSYSAPVYSDIYDLWIEQKMLGRYGCLMSHLTILRQAAAQKLSNVLIIEDDAKLTADFAGRAAHVMPDLASRPWDMFFFYGGSEKSTPVSNELSRRSEPPWRTHFYAVNGHKIPEMVDLIERSRGDWWWYPLDSMYVSYVKGEIIVPSGPDMVTQCSDGGAHDSDVYLGD